MPWSNESRSTTIYARMCVREHPQASVLHTRTYVLDHWPSGCELCIITNYWKRLKIGIIIILDEKLSSSLTILCDIHARITSVPERMAVRGLCQRPSF